jgi:hypothetical protein
MATKVLYLLGAGASHGVLQALDPTIKLMPNDIRDRIFNKFKSSSPIRDPEAWNEFPSTPDVEHFISILEYQNKFEAAEIIRKEYRDAIVRIAAATSQMPPRKNLYSVLLDYQLNLAKIHLKEELLGFISFNYEDILENTMTKFHRPVTYLFRHRRTHVGGKPIPVYKLHGSFNWINTRPIKIERMSEAKAKPALWIPPGVEKKKDSYPFNLLWGHLTEALLDCDVLRVIGCSLSRNDWGFIPMVYTMRHFTARPIFDIEIVASPGTAQAITGNYGYLKNVKSMLDMPEVRDYFRDEIFGGRQFSSETKFEEEITARLSNRDKGNPFRDWLFSKVRYLTEELRYSLDTRTGIVREFYSPS